MKYVVLKGELNYTQKKNLWQSLFRKSI